MATGVQRNKQRRVLKKVLSTREVLREIEDGSLEALHNWAKANRHIFPEPTVDEAQFVAKIYSVYPNGHKA